MYFDCSHGGHAVLSARLQPSGREGRIEDEGIDLTLVNGAVF